MNYLSPALPLKGTTPMVVSRVVGGGCSNYGAWVLPKRPVVIEDGVGVCEALNGEGGSYAVEFESKKRMQGRPEEYKEVEVVPKLTVVPHASCAATSPSPSPSLRFLLRSVTPHVPLVQHLQLLLLP